MAIAKRKTTCPIVKACWEVNKACFFISKTFHRKSSIVDTVGMLI